MRKVEKQRRIKKLNKDRVAYVEKLEKYQESLNCAAGVAQELQDLGKKLANMEEIVFSNFVVKGAPGDAGRLQILVIGIGQLYNFLADNCVPAISDEIKKIAGLIQECDSEIYSLEQSLNESNEGGIG